jgi:hypothetical protein
MTKRAIMIRNEVSCAKEDEALPRIFGHLSGDTQDGPLPINAARLLILSVELARS